MKDRQLIIQVSPELKSQIRTVAQGHDTTMTNLVLSALMRQFPELKDAVLKDSGLLTK